ncbi:MAG: ubiquinol-cytochrome c reductase cytochrome b subunit [Parcubacteria group bacterium Gr01-1014_72]|nr:MAG: ubiquinol-cytochrome c reductase cytochrome b subunit [Parcubacteria group bacterium Gr01-1014_72]
MLGNTEGKKTCLMNTKRAREARKLEIGERQKEVIMGSLLGDAHLVRTTYGFAFRVNHGIVQKDYVDWKYKEIESLTNSSPKTYKNSYYFRTVSHPFFEILRKAFYRRRRKIVPKILEEWMTPLALSVWIMDDGSRDGNQVRINSQCFSKRENKELIRIFKATLGIKATLNRDKDMFRLRIADSSMTKLKKMVEPFIVPSMRYKFSP